LRSGLKRPLRLLPIIGQLSLGFRGGRLAHAGGFRRFFFHRKIDLRDRPCRRFQRNRLGTVRAFDRDFIEAGIGELARDDRDREFGGVAVTAEVAEDDTGEVRTRDLRDQFGGLIIREMAVPITDPLLRRPGALCVILQHDLVVVGFGEKGINSFEVIDDHAGDMANIAENPDAALFAAKDEPDGIDGIMRNRERFDLDPADGKLRAGFKRSPSYCGVYVFTDDGAGVSRCVDRQRAFPAENFDATSVVAVFVSENDPAEGVRIDSERFEPETELLCGKTRVDEDTRFAKAHESTVSRTAASKDR